MSQEAIRVLPASLDCLSLGRKAKMKPHISPNSPEINGNQCKIPATAQIHRRAVNMTKEFGEQIAREEKRAKYV